MMSDKKNRASKSIPQRNIYKPTMTKHSKKKNNKLVARNMNSGGSGAYAAEALPDWFPAMFQTRFLQEAENVCVEQCLVTQTDHFLLVPEQHGPNTGYMPEGCQVLKKFREQRRN